ncbi:MAG: hypothetical protein ABSH56_26185 [Bryobacteraceae bacterium]|jgi:hypothetical protein
MTRRTVLQLIPAAVAARLAGVARARPLGSGKRLVLVTIGGIRRQESFSEQGAANIPHLLNDLLPQSLFYPYTANEGVTSHFNTISSVLTGSWEHVDDWGSQKPTRPTLFHYLQSQRHTGPNETWVVTSNKQLTANISPGVNVILSKQLLVEAVERIIKGQTQRGKLERDQILEEMRSVMETDYERIGWGVPSASSFQDPQVKQTFLTAISNFIHGPSAPTSGDELTFLVAREVLDRLAPSMLMMNFSEMEVAHSGSYSLYLGGIRRSDSLCYRLWQFIQSRPELKATTTLIIMNEFGRDPDGSSSNGFFNHRTDTESCRMAWSMVLGAAVRKPQIVPTTIRQVDMAPTIGSWMGVECEKSVGRLLPEFAA